MPSQIKFGFLFATLTVWSLAGQSPAVVGAPSGLTAQVAGNTVTLRWIGATGDLTTYFIEAGSAPGLTNLANFATGSLATTFTASAVPNGTYYVRVRAGNANETSAASNEIALFITAGCAPPFPPGNLTATVSGTLVTLGWSFSQGTTSFQLEAGSASGLADLFIGDVGFRSSVTVDTAPGTYYVRVRAKSVCGTSAASNETTVTVWGTAALTIGFGGLSGNRSPFVSHTEAGFTVEPSTGSWIVITTYGNPPPFIEFERPPGPTTTAEMRVTAGGALFTFTAVDLYSSTTTIPYTFAGLLDSETVFTSSGTVPNTFGRFATVVNPHSSAPIDTLLITLSNPGFPCCSNPVGLDNIVVAPAS